MRIRIKVNRVLRLIAKIILVAIGIGVLGYFGYFVYRAIAFVPQNVVLTNITDSSATVTWTTKSEMTGVVYYSNSDNVLTGPLGIINSEKGYDDRDVSNAQTLCVAEFNKNAEKNKTTDFSVDGSDYDCSNVQVTSMGSYYTHSVTITNLNADSTYYFVVGNGLWSFKTDVNSVKTFSTLENVEEPMPIFGKITGDDNTYSNDALVFVTFKDGSTDTESILYSSSASSDGGWYIDASSIRAADGSVLPLEISNDSFTTKGVYSNYGESEEQTYIYGYFETSDLDITVAKPEEVSSSWWNKFVLGTYASGDCYWNGSKLMCPSSDGSADHEATSADADQLLKQQAELGYGRVVKAIAGDDETLSEEEQAAIKNSGNSGVLGSDVNLNYAADKQGVTIGTTDDGAGGDDGSSCTTADSNKGCIVVGGSSKKCVTSSGGSLKWKTYSNPSCTASTKCGNGVCETGEPTSCKSDCGSDDECTGTVGAVCTIDGSTLKGVCTSTRKCASNSTCAAVGDNCSLNGVIGTCNSNKKCSVTTDSCTVVGATCELSGGTVGICDDSKKCVATVENLCTVTNSDCVNQTGGGSSYCNYNDGEVTYYYYHSGAKNSEGALCTNGSFEKSCKVTPVYSDKEKTDGQGKFYFELKNCVISCDGVESDRTLYPNTCRDYFPNISERKYAESGYAYSDGMTVEYVSIDVEDLDLNSWTDVSDVLLVSDPNGTLKAQLKASVKQFTATYDGSECKKPSEEAVKQKKAFCGGVCDNGTSWKETPNKDITCIDTSDGSNYHPVKYSCTCSGMQGINLVNLVKKTFATESSSDQSSYTFYIPEAGLYNFQLAGYTISKKVAGGNTTYFFYIESNGIDGFQMPADLNNPTEDEDIALSTNAYQITYSRETSAKQYDIKKGINIISFDFIATNADSEAYTADDVIQQASDNGVTIQYMTTFSGGRWSSGYSCSDGTCTGTNFTITPGTGYLIYATDEGTITIPGYTLTTSIPVAFSSGWNLVGIHGYSTAYTASSLIESINEIDGLTANNVSWWPTSKGKYEGISVDNGTTYGQDFAISALNGYFVRISGFEPSDTSCKSIIWNPGNVLNGTCGNTN